MSELAGLLDAALDLEDGTMTIIGKGNRQRRREAFANRVP